MDELSKFEELNPEEKLTYKDSTFEIVSKVAYLIGVPQREATNSVFTKTSLCFGKG